MVRSMLVLVCLLVTVFSVSAEDFEEHSSAVV